ncbi:MAG: hypothetical protein NT031_00080, partial [Planctomycetota bacterium]|nr:hypothetical protein [Planctomycetota bacterium]
DTAVLGTHEDFAVYLEQDGKLLAIRDRTAILRKAPFTLVLVFPSPADILVNCADTPGVFNAAAGSAPYPTGEPVAEAVGNPQHQIVLTEQAYHRWFVTPGTSHTFESITLKDGIYHCRRTIEAFVRPGSPRRGIEGLEGNALYFVFVSRQKLLSMSTVRHRERLKVEFR